MLQALLRAVPQALLQAMPNRQCRKECVASNTRTYGRTYVRLWLREIAFLTLSNAHEAATQMCPDLVEQPTASGLSIGVA